MVSNHGGRSYSTIYSNRFVSSILTEFINEAIDLGIVEEGMMSLVDNAAYLIDKFLCQYSTVPMTDIFYHDVINMYSKEYTASDTKKRCVAKGKIIKNSTKTTLSYSSKISC